MVKISAILLVLVVAGVVLVRGPADDAALPTTPVSGQLIADISQGDRVDLESHMVKGEWTLFEFTADW